MTPVGVAFGLIESARRDRHVDMFRRDLTRSVASVDITVFHWDGRQQINPSSLRRKTPYRTGGTTFRKCHHCYVPRAAFYHGR